MFSTKASSFFWLRAASLITGGLGLTVPNRGRCSGSCSSDDELIRLISSEGNLLEAVPFCSAFIGLAASTAEATVTPTVFATITETDHITVVTTQVDTVTITPISIAPAKRDGTLPYPAWLPESFPESRVSSACSCLSIPVSVVSNTVTAEAITQTTAVTVTQTDVATLLATETTVASAAPRPLGIQAFRKDNGQPAGYLYWNNGPSVGGTTASAIHFSFKLADGATSSEAARITYADDPTTALGVELHSSYGSIIPGGFTSPNSIPALVNNQRYASDIWTIDTVTKAVGVRWIGSDGSATITQIWQVSGRLYPVIDLANFQSATNGVPTPKYEVTLKYFEIP